MFGLVYPAVGLGGFHWHNSIHGAVAANWARSLCPHRKGTKRYKQWVEFYTWRYEKRVQRNIAMQGVSLVHQCWVSWLLLRQLLRIAMALQALVLGMTSAH